MKIEFFKLGVEYNGLGKRKFEFKLAPHLKSFYLGLYFFGFSISLGKNPFSIKEWFVKTQGILEAMNKKCPVCGNKLPYTPGIVIKWHKTCRQKGRLLQRRGLLNV